MVFSQSGRASARPARLGRLVGACAALLFAAIAAHAPAVEARIHSLDITRDDRALFQIETFGFKAGGRVQMTVKNIEIKANEGVEHFGYKAAFLVHATDSQSDIIDLLQTTQESKACLLENVAEGDRVVDIASPQKWKEGVTEDIEIPKDGLYVVLFVRCTPDPGWVTFELGLTMFNPGHNYLGAGEAPLPTLYLLFAAVAFGLMGLWVSYLRKHATKVVHLHRMMAVLIFFKAMSLLFEGITMHFVSARGEPVGWNVVYYIFAFLKGVTLFVVILLVGTGWTLLKPFLSEREKKLFLVVLPMQVLANIALLVVSDKAPGSVAYARWSDVLHIVDLLCCAAVLAPIFWSITHLRQASGADGKARDTLVRLTQFRQFYLMTVCYIYFTRIIVVILQDTVSFNLEWLGQLASESATLAFYVATAWKFRPNSDNPYVKVRGEDDEEDEAEFGLEDDEEGGARGVEMRSNPVGAGAGAGAGSSTTGTPTL